MTPRKRWTGPEILAVIGRYPDEGPKRLATDLGRSEDSVSGQARRCGLRTPRRPYRRNPRAGGPPQELNRTDRKRDDAETS